MDFHANHHFPIAGRALDELVLVRLLVHCRFRYLCHGLQIARAGGGVKGRTLQGPAAAQNLRIVALSRSRVSKLSVKPR